MILGNTPKTPTVPVPIASISKRVIELVLQLLLLLPLWIWLRLQLQVHAYVLHLDYHPCTSQSCKTVCYAKVRSSNVSSNDEDGAEIPLLIAAAHTALQSPQKAREIRRIRSSRGRCSTTTVRATFVSTSSSSSSSFSSSVSAVDSSWNNEDCNIQDTDEKHNHPNPMDIPFHITLRALHWYHAQHGHLVLPRKFVVPVAQKTYPSEWHGLDLASTVYTMKWWLKHIQQRPTRVQQLNAIGFVWERLQPEWNVIMEALIVFKHSYGHVRVPSAFVVPYPPLPCENNSLYQSSSNETTLPIRNCSTNVWPKATWGLPLGNCVYRIRSRHDFLRGSHSFDRRQQLDLMGFVWDDASEQAFQLFYQAIRIYAHQHQMGGVHSTASLSSSQQKTLRIPSKFVVPIDNDTLWPSILHGYPLGEKCSAVRSKHLYVKGHAHRQQMLQDVGFQFFTNTDVSWFRVVHAAAIYSQIHGRTLSVPYRFTVPSPSFPFGEDDEDDDGWPWPSYLWGLKLGQRLKDVRVKGAYLQGSKGAARKRQLDALGMEWNPKRGRNSQSRNFQKNRVQ